MPYPNLGDDGQDKNKTEEELDAEALKIFNELRKGVPRHELAVTLGISMSTLKRRLQRMILNPLDLGTLRAIEYARLEKLTLRIEEELETVARTDHFALLVARATAVSAARRALMQMDKHVDAAEEDDNPLANLPDALRGALLRAEARTRARDEEINNRRNTG